MTARSRHVALMASLVLASGFVDFRIRQFVEYGFTTYIPGVIDGSYGAPAIYRVLIPFTHTWLTDTTGLSPALVWHATRLLGLLAAFLALYFYLQHWVSPESALAGVAAGWPRSSWWRH